MELVNRLGKSYVKTLATLMIAFVFIPEITSRNGRTKTRTVNWSLASLRI